MNLAHILRPTTLDDVVGQQHLIADDKPIGRLLAQSKMCPNLILHGNAGLGKTTLANIIANHFADKSTVFHFNASIDKKEKLIDFTKKVKDDVQNIIIVDEIHRLDKTKQDFLLPHIESGLFTIIGTTTENPYISINPAVRSRSILFELHALEPTDVEKAILRAIKYINETENSTLDITGGALKKLIRHTNGDVRNALTVLSMAQHTADVQTLDDGAKHPIITEKAIGELLQNSIDGDKDGDSHYNLLSAFQKSIRGSDIDAALHYLARLIKTGDLVAITRRLSIIAYEDIGLANPDAILQTQHAINVAKSVGLPEARIPLSYAVTELALSPKSNLAFKSYELAAEKLESYPGQVIAVPNHIKDTHFKNAEKLGRVGYQFPHNNGNHIAPQTCLPDAIVDEQYFDIGNSQTKRDIELYQRYVNIKHAKSMMAAQNQNHTE